MKKKEIKGHIPQLAVKYFMKQGTLASVYSCIIYYDKKCAGKKFEVSERELRSDFDLAPEIEDIEEYLYDRAVDLFVK